MSAEVGTWGAISAERLRWRRSTAGRLPVIGFAAACVEGLLYLAGSVRHDWAALTHWQILWVTGLGPISVGLLAGLLGRRERTARGGGAWWRPVSPLRAHLAQSAVLAVHAFALQLLVLVAALPFGWLDGLSFPGPLGTVAVLALVQWGASLVLLTVAHHLAVRFGLFAAVGFGLVWAIAGTLTAERGLWWLQPWSWSVRAALPLVGTHANGIPVAAGDPLATASPWPPVLLTVALAVPLAVLGGLARPHRHGGGTERRARPVATVPTGRRPWRGGTGRALATSLRRTAVGPLLAATVLVVLASLVLWADPHATVQFVGLAVIPAGAALLPVLVWQATAPAWRSLAVRPAGPARLATALLALLGTAVAALVACTVLALVLAGMPAGRALAFGLLAGTTAAMLVCWHLFLVVRFGIGVTLGAAAVGLLGALVVGGSSLAYTLWPAAPWAWAATGTAGYRMLVCVPVSLLLTGILVPACRRAARRAAATAD